ncbi:unnamed protein product [Parnassius apollo]|uniref:(apollo) hypothetical protein n=1 Tax=Parnassius apollo TaxID=110799 RepID=A0A8S3XPQ5_PARAO|nr:unnamed protein product [Parnassius apollo]
MLRFVAQSPVTPRPGALFRPQCSQVPTSTLAWQQQRWMLLLLAPSDDPTGNAGHGRPTGNAGHDRPTGKCRARLPDRKCQALLGYDERLHKAPAPGCDTCPMRAHAPSRNPGFLSSGSSRSSPTALTWSSGLWSCCFSSNLWLPSIADLHSAPKVFFFHNQQSTAGSLIRLEGPLEKEPDEC